MSHGNRYWPTPNPGEFRHTITLLVQKNGTDTSGVVTTYVPADPPICLYAAIKYLRGDEVVRAGQDIGQTYIEVKTWYDARVTAQQRILAPDGAQYIIQSVNNVNLMNVLMEMTCQQITSPKVPVVTP
jgi:SPP1 family predicted phage head-tail adaptor